MEPLFSPLIDLVNRYSSRWKSLYLFVSTSLIHKFTGDGGIISILSDLTLFLSPFGLPCREVGQSSLGTVSPQPQSLKLWNITPSSVDIQWNNLTQLEALLHVDGLLEIFHHAHQLVSCIVLSCFEASTMEYWVPETPILLRCLQHLEMRSCLVDPSEIVEAITTPCLRHWNCSFRTEGLTVHEFNSWISHSNCNLEALKLSGLIAGDGELVTILKNLPSLLKELSLEPDFETPRPWLTKEVWNLFRSPRNTSKHSFFPNLEYFQYNGPQTFSWPDVIGSFFDPPPAYRLQTLDITVEVDEHFTPIGPNTLRIIHKLQRSGLDIFIAKRDIDDVGNIFSCSMIDHLDWL